MSRHVSVMVEVNGYAKPLDRNDREMGKGRENPLIDSLSVIKEEKFQEVVGRAKENGILSVSRSRMGRKNETWPRMFTKRRRGTRRKRI